MKRLRGRKKACRRWLTVWSYESMPSLSSNNKLYSLPSAAVRLMGVLHIHRPFVQGLWVAATSKPLLCPSSYQSCSKSIISTDIDKKTESAITHKHIADLTKSVKYKPHYNVKHHQNDSCMQEHQNCLLIANYGMKGEGCRYWADFHVAKAW